MYASIIIPKTCVSNHLQRDTLINASSASILITKTSISKPSIAQPRMQPRMIVTTKTISKQRILNFLSSSDSLGSIDRYVDTCYFCICSSKKTSISKPFMALSSLSVQIEKERSN